MTSARTLLGCLFVALLLPLPAFANPIATHVLRVRQVPSTLHVQVTFGADMVFGGDSFKAPAETTRDGQAIEPHWVGLTGGYTANTGSGLTDVSAVQFCDCSVSEGEHTYSVKPPPSDYELTASVTVAADFEGPTSTDPPDAHGDGSRDVEVLPWDIPEPTEIQGLDCVASCAGAAGEDAGGPADAGPVTDSGVGSSDEGAPQDLPSGDKGAANADAPAAAGGDTPSPPSGSAEDTAAPAEDKATSGSLSGGGTGGGVAAARDASGPPPALPSGGGGGSCAVARGAAGVGLTASLGLLLLAVVRRRRS